MIDVEGVILFFGGEGLNSSRNFDLFVSATLFLRAKGAGAASSEESTLVSRGVLKSIAPYCLAGRGVSSLSTGNELERRNFLRSIDE